MSYPRNTVPNRLLALKYGADLVWGPEVVDKGMLGCSRLVDGEHPVLAQCARAHRLRLKKGKPNEKFADEDSL